MNRSLSQEFLNKLKASLNIVDVVSEVVVLKKAGSQHMGCCPFHSERSPSFSVSEDKQLYHCFGCKASGDLIRFVQEIHGLTFWEAVEDLSERARIPIPAEVLGSGGRAYDREREEKKRLAFRLNRFASVFFKQRLKGSTFAQEQFKKRGIDIALENDFYLGFAPDAWDELTIHLKKSKAPLELSSELGLIRPSKKAGSDWIDGFRNRLMFPIIDGRGKIQGFGGRLLDDTGPKYLNSPDSFVYHKSKALFGLFQAQPTIRAEQRVLIVEGYFDLLALWRVGIRNVVATCGTALTEEHLRGFERMQVEVITCFDGDRAGIEATRRAIELGLRKGMSFRTLTPPQGLDPDEWVRDLEVDGVGGASSVLREAIDRAPVGVDAILKDLTDRFRSSDAHERTKIVKELQEVFGHIADPVARQVRALDVNRSLGGEFLKSPRTTVETSRFIPEGRQPSPRLSDRKGLSRSDVVLLQVLQQWERWGAILGEFSGKMPPGAGFFDLFQDLGVRKFVMRMLENPEGLEIFSKRPGDLFGPEESPQLLNSIVEALQTGDAELDEENVRRLVIRRTAQIWARFSQEILREIEAAERDKRLDFQQKLLKDYLDVQRKIKEFYNLYGISKENEVEDTVVGPSL